MIKVLFVCLGNICRSPTADGVMRKLVADAGLENAISIDSAGTASWHIGRAPDPRTVAAASARGFDLAPLRARQVSKLDFAEFDYVLAMDNANLAELNRLKPANYKGHLGLFLTFGEQQQFSEVPDPYHGGSEGFELVLDLVEDAANGLLNDIRKHML